MRYVIAVCLFLLVLSGSVASAGVKLETVTKSPNATPIKFKKVLVVLLDKDDDLRRRAEGGLARRIANGVAAYSLIPAADLKDREKVMNAIKANGIDGVIVMRNVQKDRDYAISSGTVSLAFYGDLWDYWGGTWAVIERPGYAIQSTTVSADIAVFSISDEKIVWGGRMTSEDPKSLRDLLDDLVKVGRSELKKQRIL